MALVSFVNSKFLVTALNDGIRVDGRSPLESRRLSFRFSHVFGQVEISLGSTIVACVIQSEIIEPHHSRPNEGFLVVNVDLKSVKRVSDDTNIADTMEICTFIEKLLKGCRAVDVEALCILGSEKVWLIRVDLHVLNNDGNLMDACTLAAVAGVLHFRLCEVNVNENVITTASFEDCDPIPLCVHHVPFSITLAQFDGLEDLFVVDPLLVEESAMSGKVTVAINQYGELCNVHKPGGKSIFFSHLQRYIQSASLIAKQFSDSLNKAIEEDQQNRAIKIKNLTKRYSLPTILVDATSLPMIDRQIFSPEQSASIYSQKRIKRQFENVENKAEASASCTPRQSFQPVNMSYLEQIDYSFLSKAIDLKKYRFGANTENLESEKISHIEKNLMNEDSQFFESGSGSKHEELSSHNVETLLPELLPHRNKTSGNSMLETHIMPMSGKTGMDDMPNASACAESFATDEQSHKDELPVDVSEETEFDAAVIKRKRKKKKIR